MINSAAFPVIVKKTAIPNIVRSSPLSATALLKPLAARIRIQLINASGSFPSGYIE
jgi:hypothetical protein